MPERSDELRFVVLWHDGIDVPHVDVMFEWETGDPLTSFRSPRWPPETGDHWVELPDHRRAYLDYEGPVSNGRGQVARLDAGRLQHQVIAADLPVLALHFDSDIGKQRAITIANIADRELTDWMVTAVSNDAK